LKDLEGLPNALKGGWMTEVGEVILMEEREVILIEEGR
jgi:hypothetical protein